MPFLGEGALALPTCTWVCYCVQPYLTAAADRRLHVVGSLSYSCAGLAFQDVFDSNLCAAADLIPGVYQTADSMTDI